MAVYRFVGTTPSGLHDTQFKFTMFGQAVEMPAELAEPAIKEGALLLPAAQWGKLGISESDLKEHAPKILHGMKPDFEAKVRAAWGALHDYRTGAAAPDVDPAEKG